jgi:hypothetical protein
MMADFQVSQDRTLREHAGQLNKVILMPANAAKFPQAGAKASEDYQEEARARQKQASSGRQEEQEDLGSPHVKIALVTILAMIEEMSKNPARWTDSDPHFQVLTSVREWWMQEIQSKDEAHVHEQIFKVRKPLVSSAGWRRKGIKHHERMPVEDAQDTSYYKIELCLVNKVIQKNILALCMEMGGVIKEGAPPPNKQIRLLKKALQDMKKR